MKTEKTKNLKQTFHKQTAYPYHGHQKYPTISKKRLHHLQLHRSVQEPTKKNKDVSKVDTNRIQISYLIYTCSKSG